MNPKSADFGNDAPSPRKQVPPHHRYADEIGDQRSRGDATHPELRDRPETESERTAQDYLADRRGKDHQRWQFHVAGAAQDSSERVQQPRHHRASEKDLHIADGVGQHVAAPAQALQKPRTENQHDEHEHQPEADADQQRMRGKRRCTISIASSKSARDRGSHAAAHRASRHGHGQDHERKHQRHRRQRLYTEPANIGGLGDNDAGAGAERDHIRPCQPQQGAQNRPFDQRVAHRRLDRRKRLLILVYRYLGDANIGHLCSLGVLAASFLARSCTTPCAPGAWRGCAIRVVIDMPQNRRFYQPTDQTNGGPPPGPALIVTGIWRPQPAARPSSNPLNALAHAG